jgi:hypothetical protein
MFISPFIAYTYTLSLRQLWNYYSGTQTIKTTSKIQDKLLNLKVNLSSLSRRGGWPICFWFGKDMACSWPCSVSGWGLLWASVGKQVKGKLAGKPQREHRGDAGNSLSISIMQPKAGDFPPMVPKFQWNWYHCKKCLHASKVLHLTDKHIDYRIHVTPGLGEKQWKEPLLIKQKKHSSFSNKEI